MADGVGVNGGGFATPFATRGRLLFGVVGGGIASLSATSWAIAAVAASSVALDFLGRFRDGCGISGTWPLAISAVGDALTRAERRNADIFVVI